MTQKKSIIDKLKDRSKKESPTEHYKNYVGDYVKRFYASFDKKSIYKIKDFRIREQESLRNPGKMIKIEEFLYSGEEGDWWTDCEDSCIITNEMPIKVIPWVANVNDPEYKPEYYNPFKNE